MGCTASIDATSVASAPQEVHVKRVSSSSSAKGRRPSSASESHSSWRIGVVEEQVDLCQEDQEEHDKKIKEAREAEWNRKVSDLSQHAERAVAHKDWQALFKAARYNNTHMVQALINAKADVNARAGFDEGSDEHQTALMYAAKYGSAPCITLLAGAHADLDACQGACLLTAMHLAANNGHVPCLKALIAAGADVHARNRSGETAHDIASKFSARVGEPKYVEACRVLKAAMDAASQGNHTS